MFPEIPIRVGKLYTVYQWDLLTKLNESLTLSSIFANVKLFEPIGFDSAKLYQYFTDNFSSRLISVEYIDSNDAVTDMSIAVDKMKSIIDINTLSLTYKYDKLIKTLSIEYNPIDNYNMVENGTDLTSKGTTTAEATVSSNSNVTNNYGANTTQSSTAPYDSLDYRPVNKVDNLARTDSAESSGSSTTTSSSTPGDETVTHELTRKGNIGVTTTQQMIQSEREVASFNIIEEYFKDINKYLLISKWR